MILTFEELRKVKDSLPKGSMQKIADQAGVDVETVRNYFGGSHYSAKTVPGIHFEKGVHGGIVKIEDTRIFDCAMELLNQKN